MLNKTQYIQKYGRASYHRKLEELEEKIETLRGMLNRAKTQNYRNHLLERLMFTKEELLTLKQRRF